MPKGPQDQVRVIYLEPDDPTPDAPDDGPWLLVEPFDNDGKFYGSGTARKRTGECVSYMSLAENDVTLELALAAACEWAAKYGVPAVWVRREPAANRA